RQSLTPVSIPGLDIRQDGEVIRIEVPSDKLFTPGTAQLQTDGYRILDEVAAAVQRTYPRQRIVVESHTDDSLGANPTAAHTLTNAQAQAVFQQLVQRGRSTQRLLMALAVAAPLCLASCHRFDNQVYVPAPTPIFMEEGLRGADQTSEVGDQRSEVARALSGESGQSQPELPSPTQPTT